MENLGNSAIELGIKLFVIMLLFIMIIAFIVFIFPDELIGHAPTDPTPELRAYFQKMSK